ESVFGRYDRPWLFLSVPAFLIGESDPTSHDLDQEHLGRLPAAFCAARGESLRQVNAASSDLSKYAAVLASHLAGQAMKSGGERPGADAPTRVLLVDDDECVREALGIALELLGYDV